MEERDRRVERDVRDVYLRTDRGVECGYVGSQRGGEQPVPGIGFGARGGEEQEGRVDGVGPGGAGEGGEGGRGDGGEDGRGEVVEPLVDEVGEEAFMLVGVRGWSGWEGGLRSVDGEGDGGDEGAEREEAWEGGELVCYDGQGGSDFGDGCARYGERCGDGVEFFQELEAILGDVGG